MAQYEDTNDNHHPIDNTDLAVHDDDDSTVRQNSSSAIYHNTSNDIVRRTSTTRNIYNNSSNNNQRTGRTSIIRILFPWLFSNHEYDHLESASASSSSLPLSTSAAGASGTSNMSRRSDDEPLHCFYYFYCCCSYFRNIRYQNDSLIAIIIGVTTLILIGSMVGMISYYTTTSSSSSSKDDMVSLCIGYIYVIMWSVSFYPQCIMNLQRRTCTGLSIDFCWYNFIGFICYTTYNVSLYYNKAIQHQYHERHDKHNNSSSTTTQIPIQSNDVAFAVHALILCTILLCQVGYYDGISALQPSRQSRYVLTIIISCIVLYPIIFLLLEPMIATTSHSKYEVLDYIYFLSFIKVCITCMKYVPQVYYNYHRRSTVGWNIWQILLDLFGGLFSTAQLMYDAPTATAVIVSNLPKFMLGNISILFDVIFIVQHYYLYPTTTTTSISDEEPSTVSRTSLDERHHPVTYHILSTSVEDEYD